VSDPRTKKCDVCGKPFVYLNRTQKRCSKECVRRKNNETSRKHYKYLRKALLEERECPCCKKTYQPTKAIQIYCSAICRIKQKRLRDSHNIDLLSPRELASLSMRQRAYLSKEPLLRKEMVAEDVIKSKSDVDNVMLRLGIKEQYV
jgi:hypothetical protein